MIGGMDCSVDWCVRAIRKNGYCHAHNQRFKRGADMNAPFRKSSLVYKTCSEDGCERGHESGGLCGIHVKRLARINTKTPPRLRDFHGMTQEQRAELLVSQGSRCASCREGIDFGQVDHDHSHCPGRRGCTECVRGILCRGCNMALGCVGDDELKLLALVDYLQRAKNRP